MSVGMVTLEMAVLRRGMTPIPSPDLAQNLMSAWARTREYVAMTAYR